LFLSLCNELENFGTQIAIDPGEFGSFAERMKVTDDGKLGG